MNHLFFIDISIDIILRRLTATDAVYVCYAAMKLAGDQEIFGHQLYSNFFRMLKLYLFSVLKNTYSTISSQSSPFSKKDIT